MNVTSPSPPTLAGNLEVLERIALHGQQRALQRGSSLSEFHAVEAKEEMKSGSEDFCDALEHGRQTRCRKETVLLDPLGVSLLNASQVLR